MSKKTPNNRRSTKKPFARKKTSAKQSNTRNGRKTPTGKKTVSANQHRQHSSRSSTRVNKETEAPIETKLFMLNKPFDVLCQFSDSDGRATLANYIQQAGIYPAGRLDRDSEGLLLLTNNGILQHRISHPDFKLAKQYLVQVEGLINQKALKKLQQGVELKDGVTAPAQANEVEPPSWLWERNPPIRQRKEIPTSWIALTISEGKNRQVRRMTAATGFPTLRLIRRKIGNVTVDALAPGEFKEISPLALHQ